MYTHIHTHVHTCAHTQSLEEQLRARSHDCTQLESFLAETKCKSQVDRGLLKKAAKLHMERAIEGEHSLETLGKKLEIVVGILTCIFASVPFPAYCYY